MLKITPSNHGTTLKLEGTLLEPWLGEVRAALAEATSCARGVKLDLADVTFADAAALELLRDLSQAGTELVACSAFVAASLGLEKP
jgi:hypothetical protein